MGLIWGLIGREAYVAVYAKNAIFGLQVAYAGVEGLNPGQQFAGKAQGILFNFFVPFAVAVEPFLVVVAPELAIKFKGVLGQHFVFIFLTTAWRRMFRPVKKRNIYGTDLLFL